MDFKTLLSVLVAIFLVQTIALVQTWKQNPGETGIRNCGISTALLALSCLLTASGLYLSNPDLPTSGSVTPSELSILTGAIIGPPSLCLTWMGMRHFLHGTSNAYYWPLLSFTGMAGLLALDFALPMPDNWHVICTSSYICIFLGLMLFELLRCASSRPMFRLVSSLLLLTIITWSLRGLYYLAPHLFPWPPISSLALYATVFTSLALPTSMMVLTNERAHGRLKQQADRDYLTGVMNHRAFYAAGERLLSNLYRQQNSLCICLLDLDHFKRINDSYGHAAGDDVLREFAVKAQENLREGDVLARYGGEEFAILFYGTSAENTHKILERLQLLLKKSPVIINGQTIPVTFSAGVHHVNGPAQTSLKEMLEMADTALYRAKADGRDRIVLSTELTGYLRPGARQLPRLPTARDR